MTPASDKQIERLRSFEIEFDPDITKEDAAMLLKAEMKDRGMIGDIRIDLKKIAQGIAVESEGDPLPGRQWT